MCFLCPLKFREKEVYLSLCWASWMRPASPVQHLCTRLENPGGLDHGLLVWKENMLLYSICGSPPHCPANSKKLCRVVRLSFVWAKLKASSWKETGIFNKRAIFIVHQKFKEKLIKGSKLKSLGKIAIIRYTLKAFYSLVLMTSFCRPNQRRGMAATLW